MKIKDIGRGIDNFQLLIVIGKFGKVHLAQDKHTNKIVAIKVIEKKVLSQEDCLKLYVYLLFNENIMNQREVTTLNVLKTHPNVVHLLGFYQDHKRYFIVEVYYCYGSIIYQNYCEGGELFDAITQQHHYREQDAQYVIRSLVNTIAYCHKKKIIHRDLKPENILLRYKNNFRKIAITDFGFARKV